MTLNLHANKMIQKKQPEKVVKRTCKLSTCKVRKPISDMIKTPSGYFCVFDHVYAHATELTEKNQAEKVKNYMQPLKRLQRSGKDLSRTEWFSKYQKLVNQWVLHVRDKDEPCCTCGTNADVKYDAGHFYTVGARSDIRFEITNIHKQCSVKCNVHGSGMRNEYEKFIVKKYGQEHLDWLTLRKPDLKAQFPNWQDIELAVKRYRGLIREARLKPRV